MINESNQNTWRKGISIQLGESFCSYNGTYPFKYREIKQPPESSCWAVFGYCKLRWSPWPMLSTAAVKLVIDNWRMNPTTLFLKLGILPKLIFFTIIPDFYLHHLKILFRSEIYQSFLTFPGQKITSIINIKGRERESRRTFINCFEVLSTSENKNYTFYSKLEKS